MRNRMYGGVRGRKTKVGEKLLRFPPTRFRCYEQLSFYLIFSRLQTLVKKSKRILHSSLKLSQVLHQDFDLTAITELDNTLFANLANTLTGKVELATDFLQTLLVATDTIAVAQNLALTVFQYRIERPIP